MVGQWFYFSLELLTYLSLDVISNWIKKLMINQKLFLKRRVLCMTIYLLYLSFYLLLLFVAVNSCVKTCTHQVSFTLFLVLCH